MKSPSLDSFEKEVTRLTSGGADMIDAVTTWCYDNNVEVEVGAALLKKSHVLRARIRKDAENLNLIPKSTRIKFS